MAENYKHLYHQMKKMVEQYQDEIVPGLRELLEKRVEVVRCKDCKFLGFKDFSGICNGPKVCGIVQPYDFCSYGERKDNG